MFLWVWRLKKRDEVLGDGPGKYATGRETALWKQDLRFFCCWVCLGFFSFLST